MKLKYTMENVELDGEQIAIPVGESAAQLHSMLRLNETASDILALLKEETTEENIVREMLLLYETDEETMKAAVRTFLDKLNDAGLLA